MSQTAGLATGVHDMTIDGVRQRYRVAGTGTGPIVVIHSGGPGMEWSYIQMPALERQMTAIYPEPIGTGTSGRLPGHPSGYTVERYARMLEGLIDGLELPQAFLLGHSHGGAVAQRYALNRPDRLKGLILYDTVASTGAGHWAEATRLIGQFAERFSRQAEIPAVLEAWKWAPEIFDDESFTAVLRELLPAYFADYWAHEEQLRPMRESLRGWFVSSDGVPFDTTRQLSSITTPTSVIVGRFDFICGPRRAQELHDGIPGSRMTVLEGSGNFGHIEQPQLFADTVAEFIATTLEQG
ncbi:MAG TPA: alpha/beta hydrolase [Conexibacter sp.]|jgi:pimeloyl-ACP methyl ester carboxylesterase